ncbi:MAG TPA: ABC transporter substrate-binding protein, partial [Thermoguttaceae bacterium]|nr:ABC transporter substrate-binding protein [Thermoguttaceae bacterium]
LAKGCIETQGYQFQHQLADIETLNRWALEGRLELTALSVHAYAYAADRYALCPCGASVGDGYGPIVVAPKTADLETLRTATIAVPGLMTTAYLALRLCLGGRFQPVVVPFDKIIQAVQEGSYGGQAVQAGLLIHEGQLTYAQEKLSLVVDLGVWWQNQTGLPLPLGVNGVRKDLGQQTMAEITQVFQESIRYGLEHREEALEYALGFSRGLARSQADQFVGMYVNHWTLDLGQRGREAIEELLTRGFKAGLIPASVRPEFAPL